MLSVKTSRSWKRYNWEHPMKILRQPFWGSNQTPLQKIYISVQTEIHVSLKFFVYLIKILLIWTKLNTFSWRHHKCKLTYDYEIILMNENKMASHKKWRGWWELGIPLYWRIPCLNPVSTRLHKVSRIQSQNE